MEIFLKTKNKFFNSKTNDMKLIEQDTVIRIAKDYTGGRTGTVVEIDEIKRRARVRWTHDGSGAPMNIRTWVRFQDLELKK